MPSTGWNSGGRPAGRLVAVGLIAVGLSGAGTAAAPAQELRIGTAYAPTTLDPHQRATGGNMVVSMHLFEALTGRDKDSRPIPRLAEGWRPIDDTTWEFRLRRGVAFHDGKPFSARDVLYSFCRIGGLAAVQQSFAPYLAAVTEATAADPHTVVIRTDKPDPLLPVELSPVFIVAAADGTPDDLAYHKEGCTSTGGPAAADFDSGLATTGTGPYRFVAWKKGDHVTLARNDRYWDQKPAWERVTHRTLADEAARVRALIAGEVDFVEFVTRPSLADTLQQDFDIDLWVQQRTNLATFLQFDVVRDTAPGVVGPRGRNPFKDPRVRAAISKAIDRRTLVDRVLQGTGEPAGQLLQAGMFGYDPETTVEPHDPDGARRLLAEAGYPDGFAVVLQGQNDRPFRDKITEALTSMLADVGIRMTVDLTPTPEFYRRAKAGEVGAYILSWSALTGEMSYQLRHVVATPDPAHGLGGVNYAGYSSPAVDRPLIEAMKTMDDDRREAMLRQASRAAIADHGVIPLYFLGGPLALRKGYVFDQKFHWEALAMNVRPVAP